MERVVEKVKFRIPIRQNLKRVAAYARVSGGKDAMLHSLSAQVQYYSELIQSHTDWQYCGVYSDEAFTGTKDCREGFQQMLRDCREGKIDMILTKSISRFARNTVTLLETVRELKLLQVDIFFEEQNIHTISAEGELILTILASFAQAESLSASENSKWRIRRAFANGELLNFRFMFGYKVSKSGIEVDPIQADIVREVFQRAISGETYTSIAEDLNSRGWTGCLGGKWCPQRIHDMLSNEKYVGNSLLQKKYRNNHLEKKIIRNQGELTRYYAENTHEGIIDPDTFNRAQELLKVRAEKRAHYKKPETSAFSGMIVCNCCGAKFKRSTTRGKYYWTCSTFHKKGKTLCPSRRIPNEEMLRASKVVLKLNEFDETIFKEKVQTIEVLLNGSLIFTLTTGIKTSIQTYSIKELRKMNKEKEK